MGIIRRICALINYRALGMVSTLVAAHVPAESVQEVAEAVNSLEGVSHNYLRNHHYNLWFTLQAESDADIKVTLARLSGSFDVDFYSLPVKRVFKLDVRFDAEGGEQMLSKDVAKIPKDKAVGLDKNQKLILSKLQDDLELTELAFDFLCGDGLERDDVLKILKGLINKGVIRRIAAVVDHRKLGFAANVLFAGEVPQDRIVDTGKRLAHFAIVSHCYQRETFEGWPYNLFAMMHGRSMGQIQRVINRFIEAEGIDSFELLPTAEELKKKPVRHRFS